MALGEHQGEGPDVSSEGVEFRAVDQDGLEPKVVDLWEDLGTPKGPAGHGAGRRWPRCDRLGRGPFLPEAGANPPVAALIAKRRTLLSCRPGVGATLVPTVTQAGLERIAPERPAQPPPAEEVPRGDCAGEELSVISPRQLRNLARFSEVCDSSAESGRHLLRSCFPCLLIADALGDPCA